MKHTIPTLTKEQYEYLAKFADKEEPNFHIVSKQSVYGDLLGSFLREYAQEETNKNYTHNNVNFKSLLERVV